MNRILLLTNESLVGQLAGCDVRALPADDATWVSDINGILKTGTYSILVVWDAGPVSWDAIDEFSHSKDDVWHAGSYLSDVDDEGFLVYLEPLLNFRSTPAADLRRGINWKLTPSCVLLKTEPVRRLDSLDENYPSRYFSFADLGFRLLKGGGLCRQMPDLLPGQQKRTMYSPEPTEIYRFISKNYGLNPARYILARRVLGFKNGITEWTAFRKSRAIRPEKIASIDGDLPEATLSGEYRVSVILPTFGRYPYLAEVLDDVRKQSIKPIQIVIGDGNQKTQENIEFYKSFTDLPIEVIWLDKEGTCYSRNRCLELVHGNFVWILDDDSRVTPDNLENHLRLLEAYGVDVSVGPSYTKSRPELVESQRRIACTFLDCGTTVCTTAIIEKAGGFDMQYNLYLANEDGEFGIRIIKAGGVILNNPLARRFHYLAPIGGARTSSSNQHNWKRWSLTPRPVQSIYYTGLKHYSKKAALEATLRSWVLIGRKTRPGERKNLFWELRYIVSELLALPLSLYRLNLSIRLAKEMINKGERVPFFTFGKKK